MVDEMARRENHYFQQLATARAALRALVPDDLCGLSEAAFWTLGSLATADALDHTQLSARTGYSKAAVSEAVALLEAEGLLRRVAGTDSRTRPVQLTEKGRRYLHRAWRERERAAAVKALGELSARAGAPERSNGAVETAG